MMQPRFWAYGQGGLLAGLLSPLSAVTSVATARRVARAGFVSGVPVICCGNATVGGAGKTILALDIAARLQARGLAVHFLTRGWGGAARGVVRVDSGRHSAAEVGDEALLLAAVAPVWVSADRAAGARAALDAGAQVIVMDDGMQNPALAKTLSLLVVDGGTGFGNGRLMPAGPLREPVVACAARAGAAVLVGQDRTGAEALLPAVLPVLHARLTPGPDVALLRGKRVFAFAGIGHPKKFFAMLSEAGAVLVETQPFPDHHPYSEAEVAALTDRARAMHGLPVTTAKDHVRLSGAHRSVILQATVSLEWQDPAAIDALLAAAVA